MCVREGRSLQQGMNFGVGGTHAVILMSVRSNAPYRDRLEDNGTTVIYEGHDVPRTSRTPNPKLLDQAERYASGALTQNGRFHEAAQAARDDRRPPERVRVYEKLRPGIWAYNGIFHLVDSWRERDDHRTVFKFKLVAVEGEEDLGRPVPQAPVRRRVIPAYIKREVWKRDGGCCVKCGAKDELHFDHVVPFSRGGTSIVAENVQLLCARHNLQKHDQIE
jgi:HNH endonuclease/SAD/SRA domain